MRPSAFTIFVLASFSLCAASPAQIKSPALRNRAEIAGCGPGQTCLNSATAEDKPESSATPIATVGSGATSSDDHGQDAPTTLSSSATSTDDHGNDATTTPAPTSTNDASSTGTPTQSALTGTPTASAGFTAVAVDLSSPALVFAGAWSNATSACGGTARSVSGGDTDASFVATTVAYNFTGTAVYVKSASQNVRYSITLDGQATFFGGDDNDHNGNASTTISSNSGSSTSTDDDTTGSSPTTTPSRTDTDDTPSSTSTGTDNDQDKNKQKGRDNDNKGRASLRDVDDDDTNDDNGHDTNDDNSHDNNTPANCTFGWWRDGLADGAHTLQITILGTGHSGSSSNSTTSRRADTTDNDGDSGDVNVGGADDRWTFELAGVLVTQKTGTGSTSAGTGSNSDANSANGANTGGAGRTSTGGLVLLLGAIGIWGVLV